MRTKDKELWVRFACAALSSLDGGLFIPQRIDEIREECASAAAYADEMCRLVQEKFKD